MALWDSPDLLARFERYAHRPDPDESFDQADVYALLTEAQLEVMHDLATHVPDAVVGAPTLMQTADGGETYTFGTDAAGDPIYPIGGVEVYASDGGRELFGSTYAGGEGDVVFEGDRIRIPRARAKTFSAGPYWRGVTPPGVLDADHAPAIGYKPARLLIVLRALVKWANVGGIRDPRAFEEMYQRAWLGDGATSVGLLATLRTQFKRPQTGQAWWKWWASSRATEAARFMADGIQVPASQYFFPALAGETGVVDHRFPVGHVFRYGCVGDDVVDDHAALQRSWAAVTLGAAEWVWPAGFTFYASDTVGSESLSDTKDGVVLRMTGATLRSGLTKDDERPALRVLGSDVTLYDPRVRYATPADFATQTNVTQDADGIRVGGQFVASPARNIVLHNPDVEGAHCHGVRPYACEDVAVLHPRVAYCLGDGVFLGDVGGDLRILGPRVHDCADDLVCVQVGAAASAATRVVIDDFVLSNAHAKAIAVLGCRGVTLGDGVIDQTWAPAIQIEWAAADTPDGTGEVSFGAIVITNPGQFYGPGRRNASVSPIPSGVYAVGGAARVLTNLDLGSLQITGGAGAGVTLAYVDHVSSSLLRVRDCAAVGVSIGSASAADNRSATRVVLRGVDIRGVGQHGIKGTHATDVDIPDAHIEDFGSDDPTVYAAVSIDHVLRFDHHGGTIVNTNGCTFPVASDAATCESSSIGRGTRIAASASSNEYGKSAVTLLPGALPILYGTALPTDGTWPVGAQFFYTNASAAGKPLRAVCVTAGTGAAAKWRIVEIVKGASADFGDADITFTLGTSGALVLRRTTPLTAHRTTTLVGAGLGEEWDGTQVFVPAHSGAFNDVIKSDATTIATVPQGVGAILQYTSLTNSWFVVKAD